MSRHALVTGGSAGLGFAAAGALAVAGCRLTLVARDPARLDAARARLGETHCGIDISVLSCDLEDTDKVETLIASLRGDTPDIVVHVAGGPRLHAPGSEDNEEFRRHLQSHSLSLVSLMQAFAPQMQKGGFGRFIAIMSRAVAEPRVDNPLSAAVRLPAWAMMKSYSRSRAFSKVTFNALLPGLFDTERFREVCVALAELERITVDEARQKFLSAIPAGRLGNPEEIGALAALIASDSGGYINGQRITIDGGSSASI